MVVLAKDVENELKQIISLIKKENVKDPLSIFETITRRLRASKFVLPSGERKVSDEVAKLQISSVEKLLALLKLPENEETHEPVPLVAVPNIEKELSIFREVGSGFSEDYVFKIALRVRQLAANCPGISKLRLWGKILCRGIHGDYVIVEGQPDTPGEVPEGSDEDPTGSGVNAYVYFAYSQGQWEKLPNATPHQLRASRKIKYVLSGDLNAMVPCYPSFPGNEASLLRCQIARISAATVVSPKGFYVVSEDDGFTLKENEEFKYSVNPDNVHAWVHCRSYVLSNGKTSYPPLPETEEGQEDSTEVVIQKREMHFDPQQAPLRPIRDDKASKTRWSVRFYGSKSSYEKCKKKGTEEETSEDEPKKNKTWHGIVAVRCGQWPGALTVAKYNEFYHLYVGYGLKGNADSYFISAPADLQEDPVVPVEMLEPHLLPKKPVEEVAGEIEQGKKNEEN